MRFGMPRACGPTHKSNYVEKLAPRLDRRGCKFRSRGALILVRRPARTGASRCVPRTITAYWLLGHRRLGRTEWQPVARARARVMWTAPSATGREHDLSALQIGS